MTEVLIKRDWYKKLEPDDFYKWCHEKGIPEEDWDFTSAGPGPVMMIFKREDDALAFALRFNL